MTNLNNQTALTDADREARRRLAVVFSKGSTLQAREASYALLFREGLLRVQGRDG